MGVGPSRLHGIGGDQDTLQRQRLEQRLEVAGLVGFPPLGDPVLADHQPADVGDRGQQMHRGLPAGLGAFAFFAVYRDRRAGGDMTGFTSQRRVQPGMPRRGPHPPVVSGLAQCLRGRWLSAAAFLVLPARLLGTGPHDLGCCDLRVQRHGR
jgi:hypothetical protein